MTDDELLFSALSDKAAKCARDDYASFLGFLDTTERSKAEAFCRKNGYKHLFYGGFPDAERTVCVFLPYFFTEEEYLSYISENPEENPLSVISCTSPAGSPALSHRDYLGSLLSLGIKRGVTGDILVRENGADIIILKSISEFLLSNITRIGRASVSVSEKHTDALYIPEEKKENLRCTVPALRLDAVTGEIFNLSRSKACEAIEAGIVYVNNVSIIKPDKKLCVGDKLVLRGTGKAVITSAGELTRKGRIPLYFDKYI